MSSIRKWTPPAAKSSSSPKSASPPTADSDDVATSKAVAVALFKRIGALLSQGDYVKAAQLSGMLRIQLLAMSPPAAQADPAHPTQSRSDEPSGTGHS